MNFYKQPESLYELQINLKRLYAVIVSVIVGSACMFNFYNLPQITIGALFFLSTYAMFCFFSNDKILDDLFVGIIILNTSLIYVFKSFIADLTGVLPIVMFYEVTTNLILMLLFDWKKIAWLLILGIVSNYVRVYVVNENIFDHWLFLENTHVFTFYILMFALLWCILLFCTWFVNEVVQGLRIKQRWIELEREAEAIKIAKEKGQKYRPEELLTGGKSQTITGSKPV
jgi:hypothetical protein